MLTATGSNWQAFLLGIVGLAAITLLIALHDVPSEVGVPIISGVVLGGIGQANGYRNGQKTS